ncbi:MAG: hypothetical protein IPI04_03855 [Ignavibacteria bacterium]|nr:hypothetical protein [Ignavibacteria bacterium]
MSWNCKKFKSKAPSRDAMISGLMEIIIDNSVTIAKIITHNFQLKSEQVIIGAAYSESA